MSRRIHRPVVLVMSALALSIVVAAPVGATSLPSGERILGNVVLEPVYDDMTDAVAYVATPAKAPNFPGKTITPTKTYTTAQLPKLTAAQINASVGIKTTSGKTII
jgi:hypothetical protein